MTGNQVDNLCRDWIKQNYGLELARRYMDYSLVIQEWNDNELDEALENFRQIMCIAFGPDESFETTHYHEARTKLRLSVDGSRISKCVPRSTYKAIYSRVQY